MRTAVYTVASILLLVGLFIALPEPEPSANAGWWVVITSGGFYMFGYAVGLLEDIRDAVVKE